MLQHMKLTVAFACVLRPSIDTTTTTVPAPTRVSARRRDIWDSKIRSNASDMERYLLSPRMCWRAQRQAKARH